MSPLTGSGAQGTTGRVRAAAGQFATFPNSAAGTGGEHDAADRAADHRRVPRVGAVRAVGVQQAEAWWQRALGDRTATPVTGVR